MRQFQRTLSRPRASQNSLFSSALSEFSTLDRLYALSLLVILYNVVVAFAYTVDASSLSGAALANDVLEGASGDSTRQILYFAIFFFVAFLKFYTIKAVPKLPISHAYNLACLWCLFSFIWAIEPAISFRRAVGMYIILLATAWCVQSLGTKKTLQIVYLFLSLIIASSFISVMLSRIPLFSFATHSEFERDASLAGAWRGVMLHKNVAGAVMIHAAIFFFHHGINRGKKLDWILFLAAVIFLYFTKSKTSLGWFFLVIPLGVMYRYFVARGLSSLFNGICVAVILALCIIAFTVQNQLTAFFSNPENLSGRIEIWQSIIPYIQEHPFLGSGYGSFWAIGTDSPIFAIAKSEFVTQIGHSHSGYFEILLTTGVIGLSLAMYALLIVPLIQFTTPRVEDARLYAMLFSIWLFGMLQNMTEAQFFSPDKQSWIFVVIAISIVQTQRTNRRLEYARLAANTRKPRGLA